MKFRFIGDPRANGHGPATQEMYGFQFGREGWTEVPDDIAERIFRHSHFEMCGDDAEPEPEAEDQAPAEPVAAKKRGRPRKAG